MILALDGEAVVGLRYVLQTYSDNCWGEGECDWENELACYQDIAPLHEVFVGIERVPPDRFEVWQG